MKRSALATAIKLASTGVLAGALVACGGSGGGTPPSTNTTKTGSSVGPVTGFGSVYVNGVHFETAGNGKKFSNDDDVYSEDLLEKGMILRVRGSWDDSTGEGEATEVEYDDTLRGRLQGPVTWNGETNSGDLTVAGQKVILDGQTVFRGATATELRDATNPENYLVRISAWPLANGNFRASFVGAVDTTSNVNSFPFGNHEFEVEIKGAVDVGSLEKTAQTFTINGLLVDYTNAPDDDDFSRQSFSDDQRVEVKGILSELPNGDSFLDAREIDEEDDFFGLTGTVEFQGAIESAFDDTTQQFVLNGVTVQVQSGTELKEGLLNVDELIAGLQVEVEGSFNGDNVLVAREIELKEGDAEVEARIESINLENETMVVGGVNVALTASTLIEVENISGERNRDSDLLALKAEDQGFQGDYVEVEGRFRNGVLEAVSIEREEDADANEEFDLDGRVTEKNVDSITVLGVNLLAQNCLPSFSLETFPAGTAVEVDYFKDAGGSYVIRKLNEDRPDPETDGPDVICSDGPDDD